MAVVKKEFKSIESVNGEVAKKIMNDAALKDKTKSNAGAKKLPAEDKMSQTMVVYFTEEEKASIKKHCKKNIPFSLLVRQLLNEKGIL